MPPTLPRATASAAEAACSISPVCFFRWSATQAGASAIGSGGAYAQSAAKALVENTELAPKDVVEKALTIAGELCIYTNTNFVIETLD